VTAVGREAARLDALDPRARRAVADLEAPESVRAALADAERVLSLAHARHAAVVLASLPEGCERVVLTGSVRKDSAFADSAAAAVRAAEAAFAQSGRPGVMLHPAMIYGAPDDRNVNRLLRLIRRWPGWLPLALPLPGGGRHTVQPVFVDDMAAAAVGALVRAEAPGPPVVVAGPAPMAYREMVRACARALDRRAWIVPAPVWLLRLFARLLPLPVSGAELARAGEDKAYDVADMTTRLGVTPRSFEAGLALKLERGWGESTIRSNGTI